MQASKAFHGLLVLDKPSGMTSRVALDRAARWFPRRTRLGHTGTLDPLATGVLVVCVGQATRLAEYVQRLPKVYRAGITLGADSNTDDADGVIVPRHDTPPPNEAAVRQVLQSMIGTLEQVPPQFSAAHVSGQRAYDLARRGEEVDLAPRCVTIHSIELVQYAFPILELVVRCSKGTYIRSVARDLGAKLGCGGYIASLRRLSVGRFTVEQAISLEAPRELARASLLPLEHAVAEMPSVLLDASLETPLKQGKILPFACSGEAGTEVALQRPDGTLLGIAVVTSDQRGLQPRKVMDCSDSVKPYAD